MKAGIALRLAFAGALALGALGCGFGDPNDRLMTDDELIAGFRNERASFDSLATMLGQDRSIRDMFGYAEYLDTGRRFVDSRPNQRAVPGVSEERWNTYARLLRRIRVGRHVWPDSNGIELQQFVGNGWIRGYFYARQPLAHPERVRTTDLTAEKPLYRTPLYRHLDGRWYVVSSLGYTD